MIFLDIDFILFDNFFTKLSHVISHLQIWNYFWDSGTNSKNFLTSYSQCWYFVLWVFKSCVYVHLNSTDMYIVINNKIMYSKDFVPYTIFKIKHKEKKIYASFFLYVRNLTRKKIHTFIFIIYLVVCFLFCSIFFHNWKQGMKKYANQFFESQVPCST